MPTLNIADLTLAIVWLYFTIRGYLRGLVKEVGSLAAIAMGFYCAGTYHKVLAPHLTPYISGNYAGTAAYLLIFTVALLGVWFLALAISGIVKITMTQWADRFFGGGFGLLKGMLVTAVILFLIHLATPHPAFLKGSRLVPILERISARLVHFIPPDINQKLRSLGHKAPTATITPAQKKKAAAAPAKAEKKSTGKPRPEAAKPSAPKSEPKKDAAAQAAAAKKHAD